MLGSLARFGYTAVLPATSSLEPNVESASVSSFL